MKIGIAGAGLVGRLLAMTLIERGIKVDLFDASSINAEESCAYVAAGMLAPVSESPMTSAKLMHLGLDSFELWSGIQRQLVTPGIVSFDGTLVLAHAQDQIEIDKFSRSIKDSSAVKPVNQDELGQLEIDLSPRFKRALFITNEGHVNSRLFLQSSTNYLLESCAQFFWNSKVESIEPGKIIAADTKYSYDYVVDTRGLRAKRDYPHLRGVRGELLTVQTKEVSITRPVRLLHPRHPLYLVPRPEHKYVIGATTIESDDDSPVSVQSASELLNALYSLHSAFAEARILELNARSRPALIDNEPAVSIDDGLLTINGLYRHGFMVAPKIVYEVANFIESKKFDIDFQNNFVKEKAYAHLC